MRLILASTSSYRRALLDRFGIAYEAVPHRCDEAPVMAAGGVPDEVAARLARAKAESLAESHSDAYVLGSDQVVDLDGEILGKPGTPERARAQLRRLRGRSHRLVTAVALRHPNGQVREALDVHQMTLRPLSEAEIERYVERTSPVDCCGAYKIEGVGIALFERAAGTDFTAIVGLPLMTVAGLLREAGWEIP